MLQQSPAITNQAFKADIPVLKESLSDVVRASSKLSKAFDTTIAGNSINNLIFSRSNFTVEAAQSSGTEGEELLQVRYSLQTNNEPASTMTVGGPVGLFDNSYVVNGGVVGELSGKFDGVAEKFVTEVVMGVDVRNGEPAFFVKSGDWMALTNFSASSTGIRGSFSQLGKLFDVTVTGGSARITNAHAKLHVADVDADGKLRVVDFQSQLGAVVSGDVDANVSLNLPTIQTSMPLVGQVSWSGNWERIVDSNSLLTPTETFVLPSPETLQQMLQDGFLRIVGELNFLGPASPLLSYELPLVNKSPMELIGVGPDLKILANLKSAIVKAGKSLRLSDNAQAILGGVQIVGSFNQESISKLVRGADVTLLQLSFDNHADRGTYADTNFDVNGDGTIDDNFPQWSWAHEHVASIGSDKVEDWIKSNGKSVELFSLGFGRLLGINLYADFGIGLDYHVKASLGIGTGGFFVGEGTGFQAAVGLSVGLRGAAEVLGFDVANVSGNGFAKIEGGAWLVDPNRNSNDGKVYLRELSQPGDSLSTIFDNYLDSTYAHITVTAGLAAKAEVFGVDVWSDNLNLLNEKIVEHFPKVPGSSLRESSPVTITTPSAGVLEIAGTPKSDYVILQGGNGIINVTQSINTQDSLGNVTGTNTVLIGTFTGIQQVKFTGGDGDDVLEVGSGFNIRVIADGGGGNDRLYGGTVNDVLVGGVGNDQLEGREGNDSLRGGLDNDVLRGGEGNDNIVGQEHDDTITGGPGTDTIRGGNGNDLIDGGAEADNIYGDSGDDEIDGKGGDDIIFGGAGKDFIRGGDGADRLSGDDDDDFLEGNAGNDTLRGGNGQDDLRGNQDADQLYGDGDRDWLRGGEGNDRLYGGNHNDIIDGESGDDRLFGEDGDDLLLGGENIDVLMGGRGQDRLYGGTGRDTLNGDAGDDRLYISPETDNTVDQFNGGTDRDRVLIQGTIGSDLIQLSQISATTFRMSIQSDSTPVEVATFKLGTDVEIIGADGATGNDHIAVVGSISRGVELLGGEGDDTLIGGTGDDVLRGGIGNDTISGMTGNDTLFGNGTPLEFESGHTFVQILRDNDTLNGGVGNDVLYGEDGADVLLGEDGRDVLYGGAGDDRLEAGPGLLGDLMYGEADDDVILGGAGVDVLFGGDGVDKMFGGDLFDILMGGAGDDMLVGEEGRDFLFGQGGNDYLWPATNPEVRLQFGLTATDEPTDFNLLVDRYRQLGLTPEQSGFLDQALARRITGTWTPYDEYQLRLVMELGFIAERTQELQTRYTTLTLKGLSGSVLSQQESMELEQHENLLAALHLSAVDLLPKQQVITDLLDGGDDNDVIYGSINSDVLIGGAGNDTFHHSQGMDTVSGGMGDEDRYLINGTNDDDRITVQSDLNAMVTVAVNNGPSITASLSEMEAVGVNGLSGNDNIEVVNSLAGIKFYVDGGLGNDTIDASLADSFTFQSGGEGDDLLIGGRSQDVLRGDAGSDVIRFSFNLGENLDDLDGGLGVDRLVIWGDQEISFKNDRFIIDKGTVTLNNDIIPTVGFEKLEIHGGLGDDVIGSRDGSIDADLFGDEGDDVLEIQLGKHRVDGGIGNNRLVIRGNDADNHIVLSQNGLNVIVEGDVTAQAIGISTLEVRGGAGNDIIDAQLLSRPVEIWGDQGNDTINGGAGNDTIDGGDGSDNIRGRAGDDTIRSQVGGIDGLSGDEGNDKLYGTYLQGGAGDDRLFGTSGADYLYGGAGNDYLFGDGGNDALYGGEGNDHLEGGSGSDRLDGQEGNDFLSGSLADYTRDILWGGAGADIFASLWDPKVFLDGNFESDTVWNTAEDRLVYHTFNPLTHPGPLGLGNGVK